MIVLTKGPLQPIDDFENEIIRRIDAGREDSILFIVPTQRKIRRLRRTLTRTFSPRAIHLPRIFTLQDFASSMYSQLISPPCEIIEPALQRILFQSAVEQLTLVYFNPQQKTTLPPGLIDRLLSVILGLKEDGITVQHLRDELQASDSASDLTNPELISDILAMYHSYEIALAENNFLDEPGIFYSILQALDAKGPQWTLREIFPTVDTILIAGFTEFRVPEREMIVRTMNDERLNVQLLLDYEPANPTLFANLTAMVKYFYDRGFQRTSQKIPVTSDVIDIIRKNLFQITTKQIHTLQKEQADSITILETKNRKDEVQSVARIIKHLARTHKDFDLDTVCICMYRPHDYTSLLRDEFAKFGIPVNVTDRTPLTEIPCIIALLGLLAIPVHGYRREDILRTLSSPYFTFNSMSGGKQGGNPNINNLRLVAMKLKITAGKESWRNHINDALHRIAERADDEISWCDRERLEESYLKAKDDIERLFTLFQPCERKLTAGEMRNELIRLFDKLHFSENILSFQTLSHRDELERAARSFSKFQDTLDSLMNFIDAHILHGQAHVLRWFYPYIGTAARAVKINIEERVGGRALATAIEETRGLKFDYMFVIGLTDGTLPSVYKTERFLGKKLRKTEEYHLRAEGFLFSQAVTSFSRHLYCTYPKFDAKTENVRSCFLDELKHLFDLPVISTVERTQPQPAWMQEIACVDDFFYLYGKAGWKDQPFELPHVQSPDEESFRHVDQMIRVERSRADNRSLREYAGDISGSIDSAIDERQNIFSITQLETYGACPFRYFALRIIGLEDIQEEDDGLLPLPRGSLLHNILFDFFIERRKENTKSLTHLSGDEREVEYNRIARIAALHIRKVEQRHPFWSIDAKEYFGVNADETLMDGILKSFIDNECKTKASLEPKFFEVRFGMKKTPGTKSDDMLGSDDPIDFGAIRLRGKIDRIELGDDAFTIVDYKTGSFFHGLKEIEAGAAFQLPLYLRAVEKLLQKKFGRDVTNYGGLFYQLPSPKYLKKAFGLVDQAGNKHAFDLGKSRSNILDRAGFEKVIDDAISRAQKYAHEISRGNFILQPNQALKKVCVHCEFKRVCRIQLMKPIEEADANSEE